MIKAYTYRIYPNQSQTQHLVQAMGCVRYIFNKGLETKVKQYEETGKSDSCFDLMTGMLLEEKEKNEWLQLPTAQCLQMALRNLDNAFTNFFKKRAKFPNFKRKSGHENLQYPQRVKVDFKRNKVILPKCGEVFTVFDRTFEGKIKTCTVKKVPSGKFFISILVDDSKELPTKPPIDSNLTIGIDLGLKHFAILSDGTKIDNPKFLRNNLQRLKVLQRRASHKQKGSNNRKKANLKVAKLYERITNQRNDFLHKLTTELIRENQTIILEDLNIPGMLKNHCLSQAVSDVGWGRFVEFLVYKAEWNGKNVLQVGRFEPSSKTCSNCGSINNNLTLKDREWTCPSCSTLHDRDINAAINIKKFGLIRAPNAGQELPEELAEMPGNKQDRRSKKSINDEFICLVEHNESKVMHANR